MTLKLREAVLPGEAPVRAVLTRVGPQRGPLDIFPYLLLAPALLVLAVIFLYPLLHSLWLSFHSLNLNRPWQGTRFVGLDNYTEQLSDPAFYHSLWLTFYWTAGSLSASSCWGLQRLSHSTRPLPAGRSHGPSSSSPGPCQRCSSPSYSERCSTPRASSTSCCSMLELVSDYIPWLSSTTWAMPTLIMAHVWKGFPFLAVMILAGLQSIPQELYEAAEIDGATNFQQLRFITLPSIPLRHPDRCPAIGDLLAEGHRLSLHHDIRRPCRQHQGDRVSRVSHRLCRIRIRPRFGHRNPADAYHCGDQLLLPAREGCGMIAGRTNVRKGSYKATISGRARNAAVLRWIVLAFFAIYVIAPFVWMVSISLKPETEVFAREIAILPREPNPANYQGSIHRSALPALFHEQPPCRDRHDAWCCHVSTLAA